MVNQLLKLYPLTSLERVRHVASRFGITSVCLLATLLPLQAQQDSHDHSNPPAPAQADMRDRNLYLQPPDGVGPFFKKFTTNVFLDQKEIWTSPFHINRRNAKWWIFAGIGTAALLAADHPVSQALPFSGLSVQTGTDLSRMGQWYSVFPAAGALYGVGWAVDDPKLKETGLLSLEALADAGIVVNVMKVVARRQRPGDGDHGGHFEKGGSSFPSGHSVEAWALASVIAEEYGNHKWVPVLAYAYAGTVSVSRVLAQRHFTSDVFVGGAIGFFIGRYVVRTERRHEGHRHAIRGRGLTPSIQPSFTPAAQTITLAWGF